MLDSIEQLKSEQFQINRLLKKIWVNQLIRPQYKEIIKIPFNWTGEVRKWIKLNSTNKEILLKSFNLSVGRYKTNLIYFPNIAEWIKNNIKEINESAEII